MTQQYDDLRLEVEFVPGTWTDVSGWADWSATGTMRVGRNTQFDKPSPGTLTVTLDNTDGRFSPEQQLLRPDASGARAVHPYWPNIRPGRLVRFSWIIGGVAYPQIVARVKGWPQTYAGRKPIVVLTGDDKMLRLGTAATQMQLPITQEIQRDTPAWYWPLTDSNDDNAPTTTAAEASGKTPLTVFGPKTPPLAFGKGPGPASFAGSNGTCVFFLPDGSAAVPMGYNGQLLAAAAPWRVRAIPATGGRPATGVLSVEMWVYASAGPPAWLTSSGNTVSTLFAATGGAVPVTSPDPTVLLVQLTTGGQIRVVDGVRSAPSTVTSTTLPTLYDSRWHHLVVSIDATSAVSIVLDGTAQTFAPSSLQGASFTQVQVGGSFPDSPPFTGYLAHLALYSYPLTSDQITRHKQAGLTWANETADDRVKRYLTYAGVDPADMLLDDSTLVLSPYPQQGRNVLDGVQAATDSEGGGSLYYVRYDGKHRRVGRVARQITTQAFAVSATDDLAGDTYQPSYGQDNLVNQVTASRAAGETDTASTQTVTDAASVDEFGPISDQLTSYARFDTDVLSVAQQRIASQSRPAWRLQQVSIDLYTAQQAGLGAEVAVMEVGTRFKVYDLDTSAAPRSEIDLIAEGWTDTFSDSTYRRVIDTSAADNPAPLIWGADPGVYRPYYSRWQTDGHTLQTAISATATTISIRTPAGSAQFTSEPGCYSLQILVGEEVITLTGPPTGSGVQTFPCLRGQAGTPAAAQAAGAAVALYPTSTWLL